MFPFDKQYLKVLTPLTINGTTPKFGEDGRVEFKETILPLTARKFIERNNNKLPKELRKRITLVNGEMDSEQNETILSKKPVSKKPSALKTKKDEDEDIEL